LRVLPEAKRHANGARPGPEQRDRAVDASAHRHGDAIQLGSSVEDLTERRRERLDRERLAVDGRGLEQGQPHERTIEPWCVGSDDALALDRKPCGSPLATARRVSEDLGRHRVRLARESAAVPALAAMRNATRPGLHRRRASWIEREEVDVAVSVLYMSMSLDGYIAGTTIRRTPVETASTGCTTGSETSRDRPARPASCSTRWTGTARSSSVGGQPSRSIIGAAIVTVSGSSSPATGHRARRSRTIRL